MVMYGSTIFIIEITAEAVREPRLWYAPWLFNGQHAAMAGVSTAGTLTHWLRRIMTADLSPGGCDCTAERGGPCLATGRQWSCHSARIFPEP